MNVTQHDVFKSFYNRFLNSIDSGSDDSVVNNAKRILSLRLEKKGLNALEDRASLNAYLALWFENDDAYKTCCLFLNQQHQFIQCKNVYLGPINQSDRHVNEISRLAFLSNASGLIISCRVKSLDDSSACVQKINAIKSVLRLINVRIVDCVLVCGAETLSFKEKGFL